MGAAPGPYGIATFHSTHAVLVAEKALKSLEAPPIRVATPNIPLPFNPKLEKELLPSKEKIVAAINSAVA